MLYQAAGTDGGFAVSGFNVGIVTGAGLGGVALDAAGIDAVIALGAALAVAACGLVVLLVRQLPSAEPA